MNVTLTQPKAFIVSQSEITKYIKQIIVNVIHLICKQIPKLPKSANSKFKHSHQFEIIVVTHFEI